MDLNKLLVNKVNFIITGPKGSGKSFHLKSLPGKYFISPNLGIEDLRGITGVRGGLNTQLNCLLNSKRMILLLDDFHLVQPRKKELILKLSKHHTVVCAGLFVPSGFQHWHSVKMEPLSGKECFGLLKKYGFGPDKKNELVGKSKGNPGKLLEMADMVDKVGYYKPPAREFGFSSSQLTNWLLSVRYFFMFTRQWQVYSLVSMLAYALLGWNRRKRYMK